MESVSVESLTSDIRIVLDENAGVSGSSPLFSDIDTLSLDELIGSKIEDAALAVVEAAPLNKIADVSETLAADVTITGTERHVGTLQLPEDFARLVRIKMGSWTHALFGAQPPSPTQYEQAWSKYNAYGTKERPVAFLVPSAEGSLQLEIFCAGSEEDTLESLRYIRKPKIENGSISLGEHLKRPTIYYTAYLTALAVKDADAAKALQGIARDILVSEE